MTQFPQPKCVCIIQEMIEQYVHWNEEIGEWQLKCVAYTGNNMRKQTPQPDKEKDKVRLWHFIECKIIGKFIPRQYAIDKP